MPSFEEGLLPSQILFYSLIGTIHSFVLLLQHQARVVMEMSELDEVCDSIYCFEHNLVLLRDMGVSEIGKGIVDETFM